MGHIVLTDTIDRPNLQAGIKLVRSVASVTKPAVNGWFTYSADLFVLTFLMQVAFHS